MTINCGNGAQQNFNGGERILPPKGAKFGSSEDLYHIDFSVINC